MMRSFVALAVAFIITLGSFKSNSAPPPSQRSPAIGKSTRKPTRIAELVQWRDKYPSKKLHGVDLLSVAEFKTQMTIALGGSYKDFVKVDRNGVESPVRFNRSHAYFTICDAHNCVHQFYFLIDLETAKIVVCEVDIDLKRRRKDSPAEEWAIWYGPKAKVIHLNKQCSSGGENDFDSPEFIDELFSRIPKEIL